MFGGSLAGSVSGACNSWSQSCKFEPHIGCRKKKNLKKTNKKNYVRCLVQFQTLAWCTLHIITLFFLYFSEYLLYNFFLSFPFLIKIICSQKHYNLIQQLKILKIDILTFCMYMSVHAHAYLHACMLWNPGGLIFVRTVGLNTTQKYWHR